MQQENNVYEYHSNSRHQAVWRILVETKRILDGIRVMISEGGGVEPALRSGLVRFRRLHNDHPHNQIYEKMCTFLRNLLERYRQRRNVNYIEQKLYEKIVDLYDKIGYYRRRINTRVNANALVDRTSRTNYAPHERRSSFFL